jgi:hypothetical protein
MRSGAENPGQMQSIDRQAQAQKQAVSLIMLKRIG